MSNQSSRSIQLIFNYIDFNLKIHFTKKVISNFCELAFNLNGIYSIINVIKHLKLIISNDNSKENENFIQNFKFFIEKIHELTIKTIYKLSVDKNGCCYVQKYLESIEEEEEDKFLNVVEVVFPFITEFLIGKYSNYIIQLIISKNYIIINKKIIKIIMNNLEVYCNSNITSNIIEIFLSNNQYCDELIDFLIQKERKILMKIALNCYGNYGKFF